LTRWLSSLRLLAAAVQPATRQTPRSGETSSRAKKSLDSVNTTGKKRKSRKNVAGLRDALDALKQADGKLAEATDALDQAFAAAGPGPLAKTRAARPASRRLCPAARL